MIKGLRHIISVVLTVLMGVVPASAWAEYAESSVLAQGSWAKIRVSETGIHRLTTATIQAAGFSDLSKVRIYGYGGALVPERLTQEWISEHDDLTEIPTCTKDGVKYFYAQGPVSWESMSTTTRTRNPYSDYGYYFITQSDVQGGGENASPASCTEEELLALASEGYENYHYLYENDGFAWAEMGRELVDKTTIEAGSSKTVELPVPQSATLANIHVRMSCGSASSYRVATIGNNQQSATASFSTSYQKANFRSFYFGISKAMLDTLSTRDADGNYLIPVTVTCTSGGPLRMDYVAAQFNAANTLPALSTEAYPAAEYFCNITNQNHHAEERVDMVIIIPTNQNWLSAAETLAQLHRDKDDMTVRIVPADELYNEFSSGTPDVSAYKRYLKMFYDREDGNGVNYVLLFGDCIWDNRLRTVSGYDADNLLLGYETYTSESSTTAAMLDDFICVMDDGKTVHGDNNREQDMRLAVSSGRLPVSSAVQAENVVNKIVQYVSQSNAGAWMNDIMFIADDGNKSTSNNNIHMQNIDANADRVRSQSPGYNVKKVMYDAYEKVSTATGDNYPDVYTMTHKQQNEGALVMNYGGHASWTELSEEKIFVLNDFSNFKNSNYPLWFTAACETMTLDMTHSSLGEEAILNANGGAIAFVGTIRTVYETDNANLNNRFMLHLLSYEDSVNGRARTVGDALRMAKNDLISGRTDLSVNKHQFTLAGDPAMRLALPRYFMQIDKINGVSTENADTLKANSIVSVSGHVVTPKGVAVTDFNGTANVRVMDSEQIVTCRGQNGEDPFVYTDYTSTLYSGSCTITDGQFEFLFRVPRGIHNDGSRGMITVFGTDDSGVIPVTAHGETKSFVVKGYKEVENDSIGPSIYSYLNSTTFRNGDAVGQTPFFVAEVSDNDGIDVTGGTIGHNLELVVDGDATKTYDLNENFVYEEGSYTTGQTYYVLPELEAGYHDLYFRAWDLLGNYSVVSLRFRVLKGVAPEIKKIFVSPNPINGSATFYVTHDLQGSNATVYIDIIDLTGRIVETLEWNDTFSTSSQTTTYHWTPSGVARGMYLYRVRLTCDGNNYNSSTSKLIISSN